MCGHGSLVMGNQKHYLIRDFIVTSAEMMKIIQEGEYTDG